MWLMPESNQPLAGDAAAMPVMVMSQNSANLTAGREKVILVKNLCLE